MVHTKISITHSLSELFITLLFEVLSWRHFPARETLSGRTTSRHDTCEISCGLVAANGTPPPRDLPHSADKHQITLSHVYLRIKFGTVRNCTCVGTYDVEKMIPTDNFIIPTFRYSLSIPINQVRSSW